MRQYSVYGMSVVITREHFARVAMTLQLQILVRVCAARTGSERVWVRAKSKSARGSRRTKDVRASENGLSLRHVGTHKSMFKHL